MSFRFARKLVHGNIGGCTSIQLVRNIAAIGLPVSGRRMFCRKYRSIPFAIAICRTNDNVVGPGSLSNLRGET